MNVNTGCHNAGSKVHFYCTLPGHRTSNINCQCLPSLAQEPWQHVWESEAEKGEDTRTKGAQTTKHGFVVCALGSRRVATHLEPQVRFSFFYNFLPYRHPPQPCHQCHTTKLHQCPLHHYLSTTCYSLNLKPTHAGNAHNTTTAFPRSKCETEGFFSSYDCSRPTSSLASHCSQGGHTFFVALSLAQSARGGRFSSANPGICCRASRPGSYLQSLQ